MDDMTRFEAKTMPITECGCRIWVGKLNNYGYGVVKRNQVEHGAHRYAWELYRGEIPKGLEVLHTCDVRSCVNPDHLFLGTKADNMKDMAAKKRSTIGVKNPMAKLSKEQMLEIRDAGGLQADIAKQYGVSHTCVWKIKNGQRWSRA